MGEKWRWGGRKTNVEGEAEAGRGEEGGSKEGKKRQKEEGKEEERGGGRKDKNTAGGKLEITACSITPF